MLVYLGAWITPTSEEGQDMACPGRCVVSEPECMSSLTDAAAETVKDAPPPPVLRSAALTTVASQ